MHRIISNIPLFCLLMVTVTSGCVGLTDNTIPNSTPSLSVSSHNQVREDCSPATETVRRTEITGTEDERQINLTWSYTQVNKSNPLDYQIINQTTGDILIYELALTGVEDAGTNSCMVAYRTRMELHDAGDRYRIEVTKGGDTVGEIVRNKESSGVKLYSSSDDGNGMNHTENQDQEANRTENQDRDGSLIH